MKIVDMTDPICKWYSKQSGDNLLSLTLKLNESEIAILKEAYKICSSAEDLQTKINEKMGIDDECYNNDFSWVTIHLGDILKERGIENG